MRKSFHFFNQKKRLSLITSVELDGKNTANPDLFEKRTRCLKKYDVIMDVTGSVFFCEFNHRDESFLPKFIISIKSSSEAKLICSMDTRSEYKQLFDGLKENPLITGLSVAVKEKSWAWVVEYEYTGKIELIKKLFRFINEIIYVDAYLLIENNEYTPLEVFECLWEESYKNYKNLQKTTKAESIPQNCYFVKPINEEVDKGSFNFMFLETKLPCFNFEMLSEKKCLLTITVNPEYAFSEAMKKIELFSEYFEKQAGDNFTHKFTIDFSKLKEKVTVILNSEIFSGYFSQTSSNLNPRLLGKIFEEKLDEAKENFEKTESQVFPFS